MPPEQDQPSTDPQAPRDWQAPPVPETPPTPPPAAPIDQQNGWQVPVSTSPAPAPTPVSPESFADEPPRNEVHAREGLAEDDMYKKRFSSLNLSGGEKVLSEMRRHPIGVLQIYISATLVLLALLIAAGVLVKFAHGHQNDVISGGPVNLPVGAILGIAAVLGLLIVVIAAISIRVYHGNRLYLTNESVIQRIQNSLFDTREQQISLSRIDDVTYEQSGLMQHIFNYGTLRLSTEGEETTYYFHFAMNPRDEAARIVNAQEAFEHYHAPHRY